MLMRVDKATEKIDFEIVDSSTFFGIETVSFAFELEG